MEYGPGVLAICDWETDFGIRLMDYLQQKRRISREMHVFTDVNALCKFAEQRKISELLISDRLMSEQVRALKADKVVILSEGYQQEKFDDYEYIYKYQPADRIARQILKDCYQSDIVAEGDRVWRKRKVYWPSVVPEIAETGCSFPWHLAVFWHGNIACSMSTLKEFPVWKPLRKCIRMQI